MTVVLLRSHEVEAAVGEQQATVAHPLFGALLATPGPVVLDHLVLRPRGRSVWFCTRRRTSSTLVLGQHHQMDRVGNLDLTIGIAVVHAWTAETGRSLLSFGRSAMTLDRYNRLATLRYIDEVVTRHAVDSAVSRALEQGEADTQCAHQVTGRLRIRTTRGALGRARSS